MEEHCGTQHVGHNMWDTTWRSIVQSTHDNNVQVASSLSVDSLFTIESLSVYVFQICNNMCLYNSYVHIPGTGDTDSSLS